MRDKTYDKQLMIDGKLMPINTQGEGKGCYVEMLSRIDDQMMAMLTHHSKVMFVRVDIHLQKDYRPSDNAVISHYIRKMRKWAQKKYKVDNLGFIWSRELCSSKKIHYHLFIMIDGNKVQDHRTITAKSVQLAENYQHLGYDYAPKYLADCFHMVKRGDKVAYNTAFRHSTYLTKERTKDHKHLSPKGRNFSASSIKPSTRIPKDKIFSASDMLVADYFDKPQRKPSKTTDKDFMSGGEYLKRIAAKASSKQIKTTDDVLKMPLPTVTDKPIRMMTDAERQLPLF